MPAQKLGTWVVTKFFKLVRNVEFIVLLTVLRPPEKRPYVRQESVIKILVVVRKIMLPAKSAIVLV